MNNRIILLVTITILILDNGCQSYAPDPETMELDNINVFSLCEGNYGASNATLWKFGFDGTEPSGPIYQSITGETLGDVAQSMTLVDNQLFILTNNSHTLEILNLGNDIQFARSIDLSGAGPREMAVLGTNGYITSWHLNAILVLDLISYTITDTIPVGGLPEDIIAHDTDLYTSIIMEADWSDADRVLRIDTGQNTVIDTFVVIQGPGQLLLNENNLYVSSTYYDDSWQTLAGTSMIDLVTGAILTEDYGITNKSGIDLVLFQNRVHRAWNGGIAPLNTDLTIDESQQIGTVKGLYSAAVYEPYIIIGTTDYSAPDSVFVLDRDGEIIDILEVGAIPGDFVIHEAK